MLSKLIRIVMLYLTFSNSLVITMNAYTIFNILSNDEHTKHYFKNVLAADNYPTSVTTYPSLYVINSDVSKGPGEHWVAAFFINNSNVEFFDSFGMPVQHYKFASFFSTYKIKRSNRRLQSTSTLVCGQYVIYYSVQRSRGYSLEQIMKKFNYTSPLYNDICVYDFVNKHYSKYTVDDDDDDDDVDYIHDVNKYNV